MICDAGGGTVDLVSYEIKSLAPLELGELVRPTGKDDALRFRIRDSQLSIQVVWPAPSCLISDSRNG